MTAKRTTHVISVDARHPVPDAIAHAVAVLRRGGLVVFPTETVYGLGARARDVNAVRSVFEAKGRPPTHPLIAHVLDEAGAKHMARAWSDLAARLAQAFWPGPLTLVVERAADMPGAVAGGGDSIAVRAPTHAVARALLAAMGEDEPIAAPSANRYQSLSPTTAAHVLKDLDGRVDLILDAGACPAGIESTVVDARGARARVLRPGPIGVAELRAVDPDAAMFDGVAVEEDENGGATGAERDQRAEVPRTSPGMDALHYAPRARLVLMKDRTAAIQAAIATIRAGSRAALVVRGGETPEVAAAAGVVISVLPDDARRWEALLFATLHAADDAGCEVIVVEEPPSGADAWVAVRDRLRRGVRREPV